MQNKCLRLRSEREKRGNINSTRRGGKAKEFPLSIVRKCDNNASRCSSRSFPPFVGLEKGGRKLLLPLYFFFLPFFPLYSENNSFSPSFNCPAITQKLLWTEGRFLLYYTRTKGGTAKKRSWIEAEENSLFSPFLPANGHRNLREKHFRSLFGRSVLAIYSLPGGFEKGEKKENLQRGSSFQCA